MGTRNSKDWPPVSRSFRSPFEGDGPADPPLEGQKDATQPAFAAIDVPIPQIEGDQCDPARFRRAATLLYTLMATGMSEDEATRRLRGYGPRHYSEGA